MSGQPGSGLGVFGVSVAARRGSGRPRSGAGAAAPGGRFPGAQLGLPWREELAFGAIASGVCVVNQTLFQDAATFAPTDRPDYPARSEEAKARERAVPSRAPD